MRRVLRGAGLGVVALLTAAACGSAPTGTQPTAGAPLPATSAASAHNSVDVAFAQQMIPHHRQAVEMARMAPTRAKDPRVKDLATKIEAAQGPEIQTMTGWLQSWGKPVPEDMTGMTGMNHGEMNMPGMMSATGMAKMGKASSADFDTMFLTGMIAHHRGAVEMARAEQSAGQNPDAVALARKIQADQTAEIRQMQRLLKS